MKSYCDEQHGLNINYYNDFIDEKLSRQIFITFENKLQYYSPDDTKVLMFGKYINIPRSQVAYGDPGTFYSFTGTKIDAKSWNNNGIIERTSVIL